MATSSGPCQVRQRRRVRQDDQALRAVAGDAHVIVDEPQLAPYNKIMMPVPNERHMPVGRGRAGERGGGAGDPQGAQQGEDPGLSDLDR